MDDNQILEFLKKKQPTVLYELTKKYGGIVKTIVSRVLGSNNYQDIEECIADTFVKLWENADNIDMSKGSLKSYIVSIARNTAINRYRKLFKENVISLDENIVSKSNDIEDKILFQYDMKVLKELVLQMNEPDREIFIRKYILLEKVKDISKHLSIDEKSVENRLYRSRLKLKKALVERGVSI